MFIWEDAITMSTMTNKLMYIPIHFAFRGLQASQF